MEKTAKRILMVSAVFPPEPVVSAIISKDVAVNLTDRGYHVTVLSPRPTRPFGFKFKTQEEASSNKFEHIVVDSYTYPKAHLVGRICESMSFGLVTAKYIKDFYNEIGVIYADTWPLFAQLLLVRAAKIYNIPIITHIQDVYPDSWARKLPKPFSRIFYYTLLPADKYILKRSSRIIAISRQMINYLSSSRGISEVNFVLVRNWQNDVAYMESALIPQDDGVFKFLFVGSVSPTASVDTLILGFDKAKIKNSKLIIAGSGTDKNRCIALAKSLQNDDVLFKDISPDKVCEVQSGANVLLLPLKKGISQTATPSKLTAYMLSKRPIIACLETNSDAAEIIVNSQCGFVVPAENSEKLAEVMKEIAGYNPSELDLMGQSGFNYALQNLSKHRNLHILSETIVSYL